MVYAAGGTSWVRACAAGLRAADGRTMLVAQGAAALGSGTRSACSGRVMRAAVNARLRWGPRRRRALAAAAGVPPVPGAGAAQQGDALVCGSALAGPVAGPVRAAGSRHSATWRAGCAPWPEGLTRVRGAVWLVARRATRCTRSSTRLVARRRPLADDEWAGAIDRAGMRYRSRWARVASGPAAITRASGSLGRSAPASAGPSGRSCSAGGGRHEPRPRSHPKADRPTSRAPSRLSTSPGWPAFWSTTSSRRGPRSPRRGPRSVGEERRGWKQ
jgi:hypothetical protein